MYKSYTVDHRIVHSEAINHHAGTLDQLMFLRRSGRVLRYHCEDLLKPQDVAQHSYGVAWLCWLLADQHPTVYLIMGALQHDAAEHGTGDIPSTTKRELNIRAQVQDMEDKLLEHNGINIGQLTEEEEKILKIADALDGVLHMVREKELGNHTIGAIFKNYVAYTRELFNPEAVQGDNSPTDIASRILDYAEGAYNDI
jgi:5'-deoxynucleotidase YfbR-like HD superfamily hydrolase